jgi:hypothetical protein
MQWNQPPLALDGLPGQWDLRDVPTPETQLYDRHVPREFIVSMPDKRGRFG